MGIRRVKMVEAFVAVDAAQSGFASDLWGFGDEKNASLGFQSEHVNNHVTVIFFIVVLVSWTCDDTFTYYWETNIFFLKYVRTKI